MDLQELKKGSDHPNGIDGEMFRVTKRDRVDNEIYMIFKLIQEDEPIPEE